MILFLFGFQAVHGQEELSIAVVNMLEQIAKVQKDLDKGTKFSSSSSEANWVNRSTTAEERARFYERLEPNETEKTKLDAALNALAKSAGKAGGSIKKDIPIAFKFNLDEIARIQRQVEAYEPANNIYLVNQAESEWLLRAVSMKERTKWAKEFFGSSTDAKEDFSAALDKLAAAGTKKIPMHLPNPQNFEFKNEPAETLMRAQVGNASKLKVHKIGLADKTWQIVKNDIDIPVSRFKRGYIWVRNSGDDYTFCHLYQVNVIEDYKGGGSYGETYAKFLGDWLVGSPK